MAFKFPFTNYHELNLTWVLEKLKELFEASERNVEEVETYNDRLSAVEEELPGIEATASAADQTANAAATLAQTAKTTADNAHSAAITATSQAGQAMATANNALSKAETAKQEAETASNNLQNVQATANEALSRADDALEICEEVPDIKETAERAENEVLLKGNAGTMLKDIGTFLTHYSNLDLSWNEDKTKVNVTGNSHITGLLINIFNVYSGDLLPKPLEAGKEYNIVFNSSDNRVQLYYIDTLGDHTVSNGVFSFVPSSSGPIEISLLVNTTEAINADVIISIPEIETLYSTAQFMRENSDKLKPLFEYHGKFISLRQLITTSFLMEANKKYSIKICSPHDETINFFGNGDTANFVSALAWYDEVTFTNGNTGRYLTVFNPSGSNLDNIDFEVYEYDSIAFKCSKLPKVYRVAKNVTGADYSSISRCLYDLRNDTNNKIIEVYEGDYDIYSEYLELYNAGLLQIYDGNDPSLNYFDFCVWVPKNTHLIGIGTVKLKWMPNPATDNITPNQCKCISPLNVAFSCTIENIEVHCKNGRYCLHNDGLGKKRFSGAKQVYKNIRFYKYQNDIVDSVSFGFTQVVGFGIDRSMSHNYYDCMFINNAYATAFYGHTRNYYGYQNVENSPSINLNNCIFDSTATTTEVIVRLGYTTVDTIHVPVLVNNCFSKNAWWELRVENNVSDTTSPNAFDTTFLNCGSIKINVKDANNRYIPKGYGTTLTIT